MAAAATGGRSCVGAAGDRPRRSGDETTLKASAVPAHSLTVERGRRCTRARARCARCLRASSPCSTCASTHCRAAHAQLAAMHRSRLPAASERHRAAVARDAKVSAAGRWLAGRLRLPLGLRQRAVSAAYDSAADRVGRLVAAVARVPPVWHTSNSRQCGSQGTHESESPPFAFAVQRYRALIAACKQGGTPAH